MMNKLVYLLLGALFLASCGEQAELEQPVVDGGETVAVTKDIQIQVIPMQSVGSPATRAGSDKPEKGEAIHLTYNDDATTRVQTGTSDMTAAESAINNAYIVQFNGIGPDATAAWVSSDIKSQLNNGSAITCSFVMSSGVKNRVYVVANVASTPAKGMKLSAFETPVSYTASTSLPSTGLPMSAHQDVATGDVFDVFQLKSCLAKLTFTCQNQELSLINVPVGYTYYGAIPGEAAIRPAGMTYVNPTNPITSGVSYYIPENLSGRNDLLIKHVTRAVGMAPDKAFYVEIWPGNFNILLGDGSPQDFNFVRGCHYNITATIYGADSYDLRMNNSLTMSSITDLNADGQSANCYMATSANAWYMFNSTVMGNGKSTPLPADLHSTSVAAPITPSRLSSVDADVLWETLNTTVTPVRGDVVTAYPLKDKILFKAGSKEGNAVIAARDASSNIIWSWHIWRTNTIPIAQPLAAISGFASAGELVMMDRNLGALSTGLQDNLSVGLLYQWGRKDPMPGGARLSSSSDVAMATQPAGIPVIPGSTAQYTVVQSIQQPTTFFKYSGDWCSLRNDNFWGTPLTVISGSYTTNKGSKSIYDPCPVGWRVPPGYAFINASSSGSFYFGYSFGTGFLTNGSSWFPASGYRSSSNGRLYDVGAYGYYWLSAPNASIPTYGSGLNFSSNFVFPVGSFDRAYGNGCRCVKE